MPDSPKTIKERVKSCKHCGAPLHVALNHCTNCGKAYRKLRLTGSNSHPKIDAEAVRCFAAKQDETVVLASKDPESERLYLMGPGEMLPIQSEKEEYYCVHLPGNELGFVSKNSGIIVELGIGAVKAPLGFVRSNYKKANVGIVVIQPNGKSEVIGNLQAEERYPIVEETADNFKIQLPNGLQGWIHKAFVLRTLAADSKLVAQNPPDEFANAVLGIAGLMAIGLIGGLVGDPEENRIKRGVDRALRDRGM